MENGFVILGIIALLFISMYGYAYGSVLLEKLNQRKEGKKRQKEEALRMEQRAERQRIIDEKVNRFSKRSAEIKRELDLLEKMKSQENVKVAN